MVNFLFSDNFSKKSVRSAIRLAKKLVAKHGGKSVYLRPYKRGFMPGTHEEKKVILVILAGMGVMTRTNEPRKNKMNKWKFCTKKQLETVLKNINLIASV